MLTCAPGYCTSEIRENGAEKEPLKRVLRMLEKGKQNQSGGWRVLWWRGRGNSVSSAGR